MSLGSGAVQRTVQLRSTLDTQQPRHTQALPSSQNHSETTSSGPLLNASKCLAWLVLILPLFYVVLYFVCFHSECMYSSCLASGLQSVPHMTMPMCRRVSLSLFLRSVVFLKNNLKRAGGNGCFLTFSPVWHIIVSSENWDSMLSLCDRVYYQ